MQIASVAARRRVFVSDKRSKLARVVVAISRGDNVSPGIFADFGVVYFYAPVLAHKRDDSLKFRVTIRAIA